MDFQDPYFMTIFTLMCIFQTIIYGIFYHKFLTPKYGIKSFIIFTTTLCSICFILTLNIYGIMPFKMLVYMIFFFLASFLLYDGKFIKRILIGPLLYAITAFVDFLFQFILIFVFQYQNLIDAPLSIYIFIFISETILIFIIVNIILLHSHTSLFSSEKFSRLFINLTITIFIISIILSDSFYYNNIIIVDNKIKNYIVSYVTLFICFISFIFLVRKIYISIKSLKQSITNQIITQEIYNQYLYQLNQYLNMKNNEDNIKHLRHDIMNYIQTIITKNQQEEQKHV